MILVFTKNLVSSDNANKGCWVQFKCPRDW